MLTEEEKKYYRKKISDYMRKIKKEKEETGYYGDGAGKRFLIGGFYLLMEDIEGAIKYFDWYEEEFCREDEKYYTIESEDIYFGISKSYAYFKEKDYSKSKQEFVKTVLANASVVKYLIKEEVNLLSEEDRDFNEMKFEMDIENMIVNYGFLTDEYLEWLKKVWKEDKVQEIIYNYFTFTAEMHNLKGLDNRERIIENNKRDIFDRIKNLK